MKIRIITASLVTAILLSGCSTPSPQVQVPQNDATTLVSSTSVSKQIAESIKSGAQIQEIPNPNLTLPADINAGQIKKYFKLDSVLFALVMVGNMNVDLNQVPIDFVSTFKGVLVAEEGSNQWTKFAEVKDVGEIGRNNPYYMTVTKGQLLLTVVDSNGAGSGEGIMKVFALSEPDYSTVQSCYYFGATYGDPEKDGDYFASSVDFSKQKIEPMKSCTNAKILRITDGNRAEAERN